MAVFRGPTKLNETVIELDSKFGLLTEQAKEEPVLFSSLEAEQRRALGDPVDPGRRGNATEQKRAEELGKVREEELERQQQKEAHDRIAWEELEKENQALAEKIREHERREKEKASRRDSGSVLNRFRFPTRGEFQEALKTIQYGRDRFHFAIVGKSGCGKSSLINAFRNLRNRDPGASRTGTMETTLEIGRYPDPGTEPPRSRMVWFDVPGAGTQRIPNHDYFVKQSLYMFDLIILAIGDRFEEIDALIVENCARFKVPVFIVRSKADMHISNMMKEYGTGIYSEITDNPQLYTACRDQFILESQQTVSEGLQRQGLPDQPVYVISRDALQRTYNSGLQHHRLPDSWAQPDPNVIHERFLVHKLLEAAAKRRCDIGGSSNMQGLLTWAQDAWRGIRNSDNTVHAGPSDLAGSGVNQPPEAHVVARSPGPVAPPSVGRAPESTSAAAREHKPHAVSKPLPNVQKMIYLPVPTDEDQLFKEIIYNDPNLQNILVEKPCMFNPNVALLTFYPHATIPREIAAFGGVLRVADNKERRKRRAAAGPSWEGQSYA